MTFREIAFGSEDFRDECELRHAVLRAPLGLSLHDEDIDRERTHLHFGLFDETGNLVACVVAIPQSSTEARIRQMAVRDGHQGRSHGRTLLRSAEDHLAQRGFRHLSLHARLPAAGFYEKMGYTSTGAPFIEIGIPHVRMEKTMSPAPLGKSG